MLGQAEGFLLEEIWGSVGLTRGSADFNWIFYYRPLTQSIISQRILMNLSFLRITIVATLISILLAQSCLSGQFRGANNLCQGCQGNCVTCQSADHCTSCVANTFLVAVSGVATCKPCHTVMQGCSICLTTISCRTCQVGFILQADNTCTSCATSIANCSRCSTDGLTCNQCRYPYILTGNKCISSTVQKITAGVQTVFVSVVINGATTIVPKVSLDDGTLVDGLLTPKGCNQYQLYVNGKCTRSIYECQLYEESGLCRTCSNGWIRTIYGDCEVKDYVLRCEDGYWRDAAQDKCFKVDVSCDWYFPNNGSCFNCSSNYNMNNQGVCVPNLACTSRQFFSNGQCVTVPLACLSFMADGTCTSCSAGNSLSSGICTPSITVVRAWNDCVFPCSTCFYAQLSFCFSCRFGYQLKNNQYGSCVPLV